MTRNPEETTRVVLLSTENAINKTETPEKILEKLNLYEFVASNCKTCRVIIILLNTTFCFI